MGSHMGFQIFCQRKGLWAFRTEKRLFLCNWVLSLSMMNSHVYLQATQLTERFNTLITRERFLSGVTSHVSLQKAGFNKGLSTAITLKRFVSSMAHHVFLQSNGCGE
jgi:hypothetical protein